MGPTDDPASLERFVLAQRRSHDTALAELRRGRKQSHWMWYVFPQLRSLGRSDMSWHYGIADLEEARAYLAHPALGPRLAEAAAAVLAHAGTPAAAILGPVDANKLRSSMTLFSAVPGAPAVFGQVLERFFDGRRCPRTLERIGRSGEAREAPTSPGPRP